MVPAKSISQSIKKGEKNIMKRLLLSLYYRFLMRKYTKVITSTIKMKPSLAGLIKHNDLQLPENDTIFGSTSLNTQNS